VTPPRRRRRRRERETVAVVDWLLEVLEVDRNTVERLRLRLRGGAVDG
jgi:hypothetical protein